MCCLFLSAPTVSGAAAAQAKKTHSVSGTVLDDSKKPVPGVTVVIKGKTTGTTTNVQGKYTIEAADDDILVFSFVGMTNVEKTVTNKTTIDIVMAPDAIAIEQVVAVGYGVQRKSDLTGAVGSLDSDAFSQQPIVDINQALAGQIAGVNIMNTSGTPGGGLDIQIRGISTIGSDSSPLYVIDDVPIQVGIDADSNPLNFINPSDIASIDILKDASAAAIYGSRASNGVVLITTKSGKSGQAKVSFNFKVGMQQVFNKIDVLSGREFAELAIEARNNTLFDTKGLPATTPDENRPANLQLGYFQDFLRSGKQGTDWQDEIFRNAMMQEYQISVSGGTSNVKYMVSGNILSQDGIVRNTGFNRYSFRTNLDINATSRLKIGVRVNPTFTDQDFLPATGRYHDANAGIIQGALVANPLMSVYDPESLSGYTVGLNQGHGLANVENPVTKVDLLKDWRRNFVLVASAYASYKILNGLDFKVSGATNMRFTRSDQLVPSTVAEYSAVPPVDNSVITRGNNIFNWQAAAQLSYNRTFNRRHKLSAIAVYEMQMEQNNSLDARADGTWTDELIVVDPNLTSYLKSGNSNISEWSMISWLGRVNYDFDGRYLISASIRADGSSKFAKRWGYFPSAAVAWRVSRESFMRNISWLHDLKFRASYGLTGNNSIGSYQYQSLMGGSSYVLGTGGESIVSGIKRNSYGNSDLTWEKTQQFDAGIDMAFFKGRISLTADYYSKKTYDLLLRLQTPSVMGFGTILTNIGKVRNRGAEFTLNTRNLTGRFKWTTNFNISFNRQTVLALGPEGDPLRGSSVYFENTHITQVGHPMGLFYGLKVIGIYQNQEQVNTLPGIKGIDACSRPGEFIFQDTFEDYKIDPDDRTIIGNPHPDFTFGFTNTFAFKDFRLQIFMRGSVGADILNFNHGSTPHNSNTNMPGSMFKNRWVSEERPGDGKTPRTALSNRGNLGSTTLNSYYVEDASFLNIQSVNLSYTVPEKFCKKIFLGALQVYVSVQNLHMFTNYTGYNPEGGMNTGATLAPGVDWGRYPLARTYTIGANITF